MDLIVEMQFGSYLYGTATPGSDRDYKAIYLPEARDILLQRVRGSVSLPRTNPPDERNAPGDTDHEIYSLQRYLELLAQGQTVALDMLFAPDPAMLRPPAPLWREIQANARRLVTRQSAAFVRYCRQQANNYGARGSRVAAARRAVALLVAAEQTYGTAARLSVAETEITGLCRDAEHMDLIDIAMPGGRNVQHWHVCGRKMPFTMAIKSAREVMQRLLDRYGERALAAERNDGVDWKALSHAIRIAREALELLATGRITLPLPYAREILAIKLGHRPYADVAEEIDRLLIAVEAAAISSPLPERTDHAYIDDLVARAHQAKVLAARI